MKTYFSEFVFEIFHPIEEQNINLAQNQFRHLWNLDLTDFTPNGLPMKIDILIAS